MFSEALQKIGKREYENGIIAKTEAASEIKTFYEYEFKQMMYSEYIENYNKLHYPEKGAAEEAVAATEKFQNDLKTRLEKNNRYQYVLSKLNEMNDDSIFLSGTIWDSDGGLLEYAIRNNLLQSEFSKWCLLNYNIG